MNRIKLMSILLAGLLLGACSSSDDDNTTNITYTEVSPSEAPVWQIDWSNNQERPDWKAPDVSDYENWTILKVKIEQALMPFVSEGDLMALFVNGEMRGLASPAVSVDDNQTNTGKFLVKVYGNEAGTETVNMSLQYYNQTLKHIFALTADINLNSDVTTGFGENGERRAAAEEGWRHSRQWQHGRSLRGRRVPWHGITLRPWHHVADHLRPQ